MRALVLKATILAAALGGLRLLAAAPAGVGPYAPTSKIPGHPAFGPEVVCAHYSDVSQPLREMKPLPMPEREDEAEETLREVPNKDRLPARNLREGAIVDPLVQTWRGPETMPAPVQSFDGQPNVVGYIPPDTEGDVGPNHYVQWVNVTLGVFSKSGEILLPPVPGNTIWQGMNGPCDSCNDGDPVVLYDRYADRWVISQFVLPNIYTTGGGPFYQYVAVSTTPDPLGSWYRYWFKWSDTLMNDYPKIGVWPDGYYITYNQFDTTGTGGYAGAGVIVLNRTSLLSGASEGQVDAIRWDLGQVDPNYFSLLPAHVQGSQQPVAGAPCPLMELEADGLSLWNVHVDWTHPSASTIGLDGQPNQIIPVSPFDYDMCGGDRFCVRQKATSSRLDAISNRLMYRLHYRRFPTYDALVVNHTVDVDGTDHGGVRWYEFRDSGSGWEVFQEGTYAPDANTRWMGSANMDRKGNLAIAYSVSGPNTFPSIRYAGHATSDPLGAMGQAETSLMAGGGSQLWEGSRWGDYSTLSVDPTDDCTFWYTTEYYNTSSLGNWTTRIGSFKFPGCNRLSIDSLQVAPTSGQVPFTVAFVATGTGEGTLSYAWDFGDGGTATGSTVTHIYLRAGSYTPKLTLTDSTGDSVSEYAPEITATVPPPVVASMTKAGNPFRLTFGGLNLQNGVQVTIGSGTQPWGQVSWKSNTKVTLKGGSSLKAKVPKGQPTTFTFVNPDGGRSTFTAVW
jgi:hypothetical protein